MERGFRFAVGIGDTFVPHAFPGHRALDEYELTQHYRCWSEDLGLAAETGATAIRYGFPWYRLNPAPGRFVWDWADRVKLVRAVVRGVVAAQRAAGEALPVQRRPRRDDGTPAWRRCSGPSPAATAVR